mgnify:CR=1 FL=1|jgi:prophage antirepressor-like protein
MNEIITINNISGYLDAQGKAWLNAEDVARGWGFVDNKNNVEYVRWNTLNKYLKEFGFSQQVAKDDFLPENIVYRLGFKASNDRAVAFQEKLANEVLPSIRKTGSYTVPQTQPSTMDLSAMELEATGKYADVIAKRFNLTQEHAMLYAMNFGKAEGKYKAITNNEIETFKKLLPPIQEINMAKFNATKLGKELQNRLHSKNSISAQKINDALCALGYQTKIQGIWELTDSGKEYANSFAFDNHGHTGFQILWKSDVLDILEDNRELFRF